MTTSAAAVLLSDLETLRPHPLAAPRRGGRADWIVQATCIGLAGALHVGALLAFVLQPPADDASGAGGQYLEAIEISIVASTVLESRDSMPAEQAAAEQGDVAPEEGEQSPVETPEKQPKPKPDEMQASIEPDEPQPTPPPEEQPKKPPQAQGGATAAGIEASKPASSGVAAASAGAVSRYAAEVRRALAKHKPDGRGRRGVATVTFTISGEGKVSDARVTASSEDDLLDKAALAAVERTSFPAPPSGMSERDLTYVIPFRFQTK